MAKKKLTKEQIEALRTEYVEFSTSQAELAEKFNVSIGTINYYLRGLGRYKRAYNQTHNAWRSHPSDGRCCILQRP